MMRRFFQAATCLLVLSAIVAAQPKRDDTKTKDQLIENDKKALLGTWYVVEWHVGMNRKLPIKPGQLAFEFSKDAFMMNGKAEPLDRYSIDPTTAPKAIDFFSGDRRTVGIYKIVDGTLYICWGPIDSVDRPKEFATNKSGLRLYLLKRTKE